MSTLFGYVINDMNVVLLFLAFVGYGFTKVFSDKMLWYPERYVFNDWWKHAKKSEQRFKPVSNYLAFLKDGYHLLELIKASWIFVAAGVFDLVVASVCAFIAFVTQKVWMK